jgi:radical SAM protein with 4Fe4S-binding SPASM domain
MAHGKYNHSFRELLANSFEKQRWMDITYLMKTGCEKCFALGICGGGCLYNIFINTGTLHGKDEDFCSQTRGLLHWAIEDIVLHAEKRKSLEEDGFIAVTSQDRKALMPAQKNPAYDR